ncbi:DDE Tnp4 domain-containing protein [Mycena indigotica]|uniref:DDE Tnp4 domain-containing protein n=1 Tax=Mycena indigotica TaxID=2126181 RepID=A0A8H6SQU3_9AGAR|nr:DDE Tnp4 domain-containing protein [Mycena indigotica]KAF7304138.1 DDE Tnp4 domain-containing protein [Mycena indigotica]
MPYQTLADIENDVLDAAATALFIADLLGRDTEADDDDDDTETSSQEGQSESGSDSEDGGELEQMLVDSRQQTETALTLFGAMLVDEAASLRGDGTRGPYFRMLTTNDWFVRALDLPDRQFRSVFRISRPTFDTFCTILGPNPIFHSTGRKPQRDISWQLGAFLIRYGQLGSSVQDTALKLGVGYGTVLSYCRRVIRAIRMLKSKYASWLSEEEQQCSIDVIRQRTGFTDCVGSGDGSLVQSSEQPLWMGSAYLSRKGFMAYSVFAIVDSFAAWDLGWPGSVTDARVFKNSHFWRFRHQYLQFGHRILVDKGYASTPFTIRPFSEPELASASAADRHRMKNFNYLLSTQRITVEHAFGCLKLRFRSMQMMGGHKQVQNVWRAIEAMMIMHNMCLIHDDHPNRFKEYTPGMGDQLAIDTAGNDADIPEEAEPGFIMPNVPAYNSSMAKG